MVGANAFGAEAAPAPGQCRVLPDGSLLAAGTGLALPGMMARARHVRQAALALTVLVVWRPDSGYLLIADQGEKAEAAQGVLRESLKQAEWGGMPDWQVSTAMGGSCIADS